MGRGARTARRHVVAGFCSLVLAVAVAAPHDAGSVGAPGFVIRTIETRPGVTERIALGHADDPAGTLLMFPGGNGAGHFRESAGVVILGNNFLVRTAVQYVARGFTVAILDVPSDHQAGMLDAFRSSRAHVDDVERVVAYVAAQSPGPIYLVGTSSGTESVGYLGTVLKDARIRGIVLTSTLESVTHLPLGRVSVPVLIVHHRHDGCRASPFGGALRLPGLLRNSPKVTFVEVRGGSPPQSGACEVFAAHGFFGMETPVVDVIARWAAGERVPPAIGP
jgi:pimeloyl-ACP methyl ester carboxylesterase